MLGLHSLCGPCQTLVFIPSANSLCQQVPEIPGRRVPFIVQRAGDWPWPPVSSGQVLCEGRPVPSAQGSRGQDIWRGESC